jgi:hypothetical protein
MRVTMSDGHAAYAHGKRRSDFFQTQALSRARTIDQNFTFAIALLQHPARDHIESTVGPPRVLVIRITPDQDDFSNEGHRFNRCEAGHHG